MEFNLGRPNPLILAYNPSPLRQDAYPSSGPEPFWFSAAWIFPSGEEECSDPTIKGYWALVQKGSK
jgi:hypothetical protein